MLVAFTNEVCVKFCFKISIIHAKDYMQPQIDGIEILTQICETKKRKMQEKGISLGYDLPQKREFPLICPTLLNDRTAPFVIAEVKRKSPTKGHISTITEPTKLAQIYINQGANAISVLCEEDYFQGSLQDLYAIKRAFPQACILRKDFILHKDEARVSYLFGAAMVLLIVALFVDDMESFCAIYDELLAYNLTPLIEIHTLAEYNLIKDLNLEKAIVGINTRNLKTFQINKMEAMKLRAQIPKHIPVIFESGIQSEYDSFMAGSGGFQGILCGSFLVEQLDKKEAFLESSGDLVLSYVESKKSKMPTAEVFLDNFKGCADSCARSLLDINDEAQEANSLESAKKTTQTLESLSNERKNILLNELKTRVNDLISMRNAIAQILNTPLTLECENVDTSQQAYYDKALYNKLFTQDTKAILEQALSQFIDKLQNATLNIDSTKSLIQEHANNIANTFAIKPSIFMQALRLGLLGQKGGIDLGACLCILDKDESIKRIQNLIEFAKQN